MEIIKELKSAGLSGLGGAGFPTWQKWQTVLEAEELKRFVICNLSEGEPGVFKDELILKSHLPELIAGIELAASTVSAAKSFIFLNDKFKKYLRRIKKAVRGKKIEIFIDTGRYLCGEETTLLQVMKGKLRQPRSKPPFPTASGLYGFPTLINNAETLYRAKLVADGNYKPEKFYCLSGDTIKPQIIEAGVDESVEKVIAKAKIPAGKFFRIAGASGYFLPNSKAEQKVEGVAAIEIFSEKIKILDALSESIIFLKDQSCGKCTPCREGNYRIAELINRLYDTESLWDRTETIDLMAEIAQTAADSSFCPLGGSIARPVLSAINEFREELTNG